MMLGSMHLNGYAIRYLSGNPTTTSYDVKEASCG